jgi:hypothetical protein
MKLFDIPKHENVKFSLEAQRRHQVTKAYRDSEGKAPRIIDLGVMPSSHIIPI